MKPRPRHALGLAILAAVMLALAGAPTGQAQGVEWWDDDHPFRVIVNAEGPVFLPGGGTAQPTSLLGYHLDIEDELVRAKWPSAVDAPPDPETITIIPYDRLAEGTTAGDPIPRTVLDPMWAPGTCEASSQADCLVVWEEDPSARAYGIYWAPEAWEVDPPQPGLGPSLAGHGLGHEHWVIGDGFPDLKALIGPQTTPTLTQRLDPSGWMTIDISCPQGGGCNLQPRIHRVFTEQPSRVTVYQDQGALPPRALPLSGPLGAWGTSLGLPLPSIDPNAEPRVDIWPRADACQPQCDITVNGQSQTVREDNAKRIPMGQSVMVQSPEPIQGALHGDGLAPVLPRDVDGMDFIVPVHDRFTIISPTGTTVSVENVRTGQTIQSAFEVPPGVTIAPVNQEHDLLRIQAQDPITVFSGSARDTEIPHHQPLNDLQKTLLPADANVYLIAPLGGFGASRAETLTPNGEVESTSNLPIGGLTLVTQAQEDPRYRSIRTNATLGTITVQDGAEEDAGPLLGQALTFTYPQRVERLTADYQAPVVDVSIDPSSQFAGAGETVTFDVDVTNLAQGPGTDGGLSVALDLEPVGRAADMDITATLGAATVHLPGDYGATETVPLNIRVPEDVSDTVITMQVTAHSEDAPDLTAQEQARVSVVTIRDFDLSYEDGTTSRTEMLQPDGETTFTIQAENTGTIEIDLHLTQDTLGDEDFHTCIRAPDADCTDEATIEQLQPGETRTLYLRIQAPDRDDEGRIDVTLRGEIQGGQGPVRNVDATALLNVPVAATFTAPEALLLAPGENATFDIEIENLGVQADATLQAATTEGPVQGWLLDDDDEPAPARETLLGPVGTDRATWTETASVAVSEDDATPGLTREVRFLLELEPGGGLPPYRDTVSIPVNVIRVLEPIETNHTLSPGIPTQLDEPIHDPNLAQATLRTAVQNAPPGWDVQTPATASFDADGRGSLPITITPAPGQPPGTGTITLALEDPMGPGTTVTLNAEIPREPVAAIQTPPTVRMALGDEATVSATVQNVGNQPLEGALETTFEGMNLTTTPTNLTLDPTEETTLALHLDALSPIERDIDIVFMDGNRIAGLTTINVTALRAQLALASATATPAGERLLVTANVQNQGNVSVHELDVALYHQDELVETRTVERLAPGQPVPVPIEWDPQGTLDIDDLEVRLDPQGAYLEPGAGGQTQSAPVEWDRQDETPTPLLALILTTLATGLLKRRPPQGMDPCRQDAKTEREP